MACSPSVTHVRVVAAVIRRDGRCLVARRPEHKHHGGLWEFPGGKLEPGETGTAALARELAEELGLELLTRGALIHTDQPADDCVTIEFIEAAVRGEPELREHTALAWQPVDQLGALELAPADARCARALQAAVSRD